MSATLIKSTRGKDVLLLENFTFAKDREMKSGEVSWRCSQRKTNACNATVFTIGPELLVSRGNLIHSHEANEPKLNRKIISNSCKRKAVDDISEKPSKIIRKVLATNLPESLTTIDVSYIRKTIYNSRRKILPGPLPTNIQEVHDAVDLYSNTFKTSKGEHFLLINSRENNIIVFTCETNIRTLCKMNVLYMDGTFSYCTKFFLQLFTIHGLCNGHYVPLVYCLLPNKSTDIYKHLFSLLHYKILETYSIALNPSKVFVDFEIAIHKALIYMWPNTVINGCRFHLHQAWYRKIQSLGLMTEYTTNSDTGKWLKTSFGLTYLNADEVGDCFVFDLMASKPENAVLDRYADYLLETYIEENSTFPPSIWAEKTASITRTTNACESFHSRFNSSFYCTHPSVYIFIEKLKDFQIDTYVTIQSLSIPKKIKDKSVKQKIQCLEKFIQRFDLQQISRLEYIKFVSHLSLPVEKYVNKI